METILEYLDSKYFPTIPYILVVVRILIGGIFFYVFVDMENNDSRYDFRCSGAKSENIDFVRGKCYEKYMKHYNKFGFPFAGFVILNLALIAVVCAIYSHKVRPKVDQLLQERQLLDQETASSTGKTLFPAYCWQLLMRLLIGVIFIIFQTRLLYPLHFPSDFNCYLTNGTTQPRKSSDNAQNRRVHDCHNARAQKNNFWMSVVLWVNIAFVVFILVETVYLLWACIDRSFMQDSKFLKIYLGRNQHQKRKFQIFVECTKKVIRKETLRPPELQSPFLGDPGDDTTLKHLSFDEVFTDHEVIANREMYDFPENREKQLRVYTRSHDKESQPKSLEGPLNDGKKRVLIIGRPGIGKTFYCTKLLRDWALDKLFNPTSKSKIHFDVAFLVNFRKFNSAGDLSLRELLIQSEYYPEHHMNDEVWNQLLENPEGVLILFDGFDELKRDKNKAKEPLFPISNEDKKPLLILYRWLVNGKLLKGASVFTTTRSTALSGLRQLSFDKTYEILGFSLKQIEKYVNKFEKEVGETLWKHISSNMNLLSLCYVPVNSFIICTSLLQFLRFDSPTTAGVTLPSKLTTIYEMAVKVFYFQRSKEFQDKRFTREDYESNDLHPDVEKEFKKLGRVAFEGIIEGKLILGGNEVRGIEDSALFHRLPDRQRGAHKHEPQFCFIHLTVQEFFAARHLANNMKKKKLRKFVSRNIENGKWQMVFQFLAGLMEDKKHLPSKIITGLLPVETEESLISASYNEQCTENEEPRKVTCWPTRDKQHLATTLIKCANEHSIMKLDTQRKLHEIDFNFVRFKNCYLTPFDCSLLVKVIDAQQISHINLGFNNIGSLGCLEICKFLKCRESQLSWLDLKNNSLTEEAAKYLAEAMNNKNCQLRELGLAMNKISDIGAHYLAEAISNNGCQLRTLLLNFNHISDKGAKHLAEAINNNNNCQLHTLTLAQNLITDTGAQHLADAIKNKNCQLRTLDLSVNQIKDIGAKQLAEAIINNNNCQLHVLNLARNTITDIGAQHLAKVINNNNCQLRTLDLRANKISDTGVQYLADAINNNNNCLLRSLYLPYNEITDIGAQRLADAIKNKNCQLRTLDLTANGISDIGAQHLADAINNNNCQLRTLDLTANNISDIGAQHLAEAINNNNCQLHTLNLSYNNISHIGAQHLAEAINNNNCQLRMLNLSNNHNITNAGKYHTRNLLSNRQSQCQLIL